MKKNQNLCSVRRPSTGNQTYSTHCCATKKPKPRSVLTLTASISPFAIARVVGRLRDIATISRIYRPLAEDRVVVAGGDVAVEMMQGRSRLATYEMC